MLLQYITGRKAEFMSYAAGQYSIITEAFATDNAGVLGKTESGLARQKTILKNARRKETLCLRRLPRPMALEKSTWFYLGNNTLQETQEMVSSLRKYLRAYTKMLDSNYRTRLTPYESLVPQLQLQPE